MPTRTTDPIDRRSFPRRGTLVAAGAAGVTPFHALSARAAADVRGGGRGRGCSPDYGPLAPVRDHTTGLRLLQLPAGFEYIFTSTSGGNAGQGQHPESRPDRGDDRAVA